MSRKKPPTLSEKRKLLAEKKRRRRAGLDESTVTAPPRQEVDELLSLYEASNFVEAESLAREQLTKFPNSLMPLKVLGACLGQTKRFAESIDVNRQLILLNPEDAMLTIIWASLWRN